MKKLIAAVAVLVIFAAAALGACGKPENALSEKVFRLHVVANSDSEADQAVKMKVRDAVVNLLNNEILADAENMEDAREIVESEIAELKAECERVLKSEGFDYGVTLAVGEYDFPSREYGGKVFPAGRYEALRVTLGSGNGQNWWCVLFPPLCFLDMTYVSDNGQNGEQYDNFDGLVVDEDVQVEYMSKFLEIIKELFG